MKFKKASSVVHNNSLWGFVDEVKISILLFGCSRDTTTDIKTFWGLDYRFMCFQTLGSYDLS